MMKGTSIRKPLRIGLCYDLKSDYLAAGFAPHEVMELDEEETAVIERMLELGVTPVYRVRNAAPAGTAIMPFSPSAIST